MYYNGVVMHRVSPQQELPQAVDPGRSLADAASFFLGSSSTGSWSCLLVRVAEIAGGNPTRGE